MTKIFSKTKGISFNKSFLEKIAEKGIGEVYAGFKINENSIIFKDDYRTSCEVIIEKDGAYFKVPYIIHFGEKHIGVYNPYKEDRNNLGKKYFCERINPLLPAS